MFECYFRKPGIIMEFIDQDMNKPDIKGIIDPIVNDLDRLTYLTVLHRIWKENTNRALDFRIEDSSNYWLANKHMIDYASSVFNLKEYIEHYSDKGKRSSIYAPVKEAYECDQSWIKLLCEFRNYLTHHASLLKHYEGYSGELIVDMDDFVSYETMDRGKDPRWKGFLDWLKQMRDSLGVLENIHYFRAPALVQRANQEIKAILDKVYTIIFDEQARAGLRTLLSLIHKEEGNYYFTHYEDEDNQVNIYPCQLLKDYFVSMISHIEDDSTLSQELYDFFRENNYSFDI